VSWHRPEEFGNPTELLAFLGTVVADNVAIEVEDGKVRKFVVFPGGEQERAAFLERIASHAAQNEDMGERYLAVVGSHQVSGKAGGEQTLPDSARSSSASSSVNNRRPSTTSTERGRWISPDYTVEIQAIVGHHQVTNFATVARQLPAKTPGALRRALTILARDGELLRAYDAGGAVWYALPDLPERVHALLGPRPLSVTDIALGLAGRVWSREEVDGLEAILRASGFEVEASQTSRKESADAAAR
jgi:hypothetical protein